MRIVTWDNTWSVGVEEIDHQHRKLIDMINRLESARMNGMSASMIGAILGELMEYSDYHFGLEEMYFDEFNFEDAARHKMAHRALTVQVRSFQRAVMERREGLSDEVTRFLQDWLSIHIKGSDQQYRECFARNGLK